LFTRYESKEAVKRQLAESKNKLEALIYEIREKIETDDFAKYAQDSEKERLRTLLEEKGAWYEETSSSIADDYFKEHKELNAPVEKIKKRMVEHREREDVRKRALELVEEYAKLATKVQKGKAWITDEEVATLSKNITAAKDNINNLYGKLNSLKLNEDSVVHNKDLIKAADIAKDYYFLLKGKAKPKDWKEAKGEDEKKEEKKEEESKEEESEGETDSKDD
jgi:hypoxia up-regulated 1